MRHALGPRSRAKYIHGLVESISFTANDDVVYISEATVSGLILNKKAVTTARRNLLSSGASDRESRCCLSYAPPTRYIKNKMGRKKLHFYRFLPTFANLFE